MVLVSNILQMRVWQLELHVCVCVCVDCAVYVLCEGGHSPLVCSFLPLMPYLFQYLLISRELESWLKGKPVVQLSHCQSRAQHFFIHTVVLKGRGRYKKLPWSLLYYDQVKLSVAFQKMGVELRGMGPESRKLQTTRSGGNKWGLVCRSLEPSLNAC